MSVAGISHPGTSSSFQGRYSCHSGTNTPTRHGPGQGAQTQRLPEWEPGHLGEAAGGGGWEGEVSSRQGPVLGSEEGGAELGS